MDKNINSIELWAENLSKKPIRILTDEEAGSYFRYTFAEMRDAVDEEGLKKLLEEKQGGMASVFYLRVKYGHTYRISPTVAVFFAETVIKNFAISTMLANYIQYFAYKNNVKYISMTEVAKIFPNGFPEEESWSEAWSENKIKVDPENGFTSDNGLDYPALMESIRNIGDE